MSGELQQGAARKNPAKGQNGWPWLPEGESINEYFSPALTEACISWTWWCRGAAQLREEPQLPLGQA